MAPTCLSIGITLAAVLNGPFVSSGQDGRGVYYEVRRLPERGEYVKIEKDTRGTVARITVFRVVAGVVGAACQEVIPDLEEREGET